jgi:transcriptional regulator with XRE-family HTH domain
VDTSEDSPAELARLLRQLRRREARRRGASELTYRELAAKTGWARATIGNYLSGKTLPPTDRFDALVRLLGATEAELGRLATLRDGMDEVRRRGESGAPPRRITGYGRVLPRQLPKPVRHLAGRRAEIEALTRLAGIAVEGKTAAVVLTIGGMAGVGKTALAVFWAHQVADQFPDGQLYVNLRGFTPAGGPLPPQHAVRGFLEALGVAPDHVPLELDAQTALYRSLLTGRRMLVLLDNAYDADQVRPLLPASAGCLAVVTSRSRLTGLIAYEDALPLTVDVLSDAQARELLAARLGADRLQAEPQAVERIIRSCAGLPLALSIAAARAVGQVEVGPGTLGREPSDAQTELDGLGGHDRPPGSVLLVVPGAWAARRPAVPTARPVPRDKCGGARRGPHAG